MVRVKDDDSNNDRVEGDWDGMIIRFEECPDQVTVYFALFEDWDETLSSRPGPVLDGTNQQVEGLDNLTIDDRAVCFIVSIRLEPRKVMG